MNPSGKLTPKAFANFSPGLVRSDNPGIIKKEKPRTLKGLGLCAVNPFRVSLVIRYAIPGFSLRSNPELKLANAFGVFAEPS